VPVSRDLSWARRLKYVRRFVIAGYTRELLRDLSLLDVEDIEAGSELHIARTDLYSAIEALYAAHILTDAHILALNLYYMGNFQNQLMHVPNIEALLSFALKQITHYAGHEYSDAAFIQRALLRYPKYKTIREALMQNLEKMGDTFELA
jgi:hypothetical protein